MKEDVKKWLLKAFEDFKTANHETLLPEDEMVTSAVCFHCQQFVEKALKAYLTLKGVEFGGTHNLELLLEFCVKVDRDFEEVDVGDLTFYVVEIRYPDEFYIPTVEEAKKCFDITKKARKFILGKLGVNNLTHYSP